MEESGPGADAMVLLARLVRPQGRHGEILADLLTDFPERFSERKRLFLVGGTSRQAAAPRKIILERHWLHKGRVVLKFTGIDSINDAEPLRGFDVAIPREERATLEGDAVYIDDLVGCRVFDLNKDVSDPHNADSRDVGDDTQEEPAAQSKSADSTYIGKVKDVDRESTAHPLLVLESEVRAEEVLIPFVKAFLVRMDLPSRRIEMKLPQGLLELNAPLTAEERGRRHLEQTADEEPGESSPYGSETPD
ncbi:MAG TPA: ribosome maturation factor RimM [Acidisarcina sp.]